VKLRQSSTRTAAGKEWGRLPIVLDSSRAVV
jgi:hypothetical protein